jgi:hypothetical protein
VKLYDMLSGIEILKPYYNDPHGYNIGADHDIIYFYATDTPLSEADQKRMFDLGFNQCDSEESEDGEHTIYDPENSWSCYV